MFTYEECFDIVKKKIRGKFVTFSEQLANSEYCFYYFDHQVGSDKDDMPTNPYSVTVDPETGKVKYHDRAHSYFLEKEHWPLENTSKKIMTFA